MSQNSLIDNLEEFFLIASRYYDESRLINLISIKLARSII